MNLARVSCFKVTAFPAHIIIRPAFNPEMYASYALTGQAGEGKG